MTISDGLAYHFTDTARLPFILRDGYLRPGRNRLGGFPSPDFLWATTNHAVDATATGYDGYRKGITRLVRITLERSDFQPIWRVIAEHPAWTAAHLGRLIATAQGSNSDAWLARSQPLRSDRWIRIESRSYADRQWAQMAISTVPIDLGAGRLGIEIGGKIYWSAQFEGPRGSIGYDCGTAVCA